jgi:hypothetical protein
MANGPALRVITTQKSQSTVKSDTRPAQAQGNELAMALQGMEAASAAFAESIIKDPSARADYTRKTAAARAELIQLVKEGKITPHEAARTANAIRNQIMELTRAKLTDFGLALSKDMKASGRPLDYMQSLKANEMFGRPFESLTSVQKEKVWVQIVESAGKSNHGVNMRVKLYGAAGRVFWWRPSRSPSTTLPLLKTSLVRRPRKAPRLRVVSRVVLWPRLALSRWPATQQAGWSVS